MTKKISLGKGFFALMDDEDFEYLNQFKWYYRRGYAIRQPKPEIVDGKIKYQTIMMHREIIKAPKGMMVDHKNRDRLDNRKENLRICTRQENVYNRRDKNSSSKYKGVRFNRYCPTGKQWVVYVTKDGKYYPVGRADKEDEAALMYNEAAKIIIGEFAYLNKVF